MQPSADSLHAGNYIGALLQWKELQITHDAVFCVVDLHAITVPQDPAKLRESTRRTAAQYIAAGIDPASSILFVQSHVARARRAGLGAEHDHRLRRGQPHDPVQGQVGQAGCRTRRVSGCSPTRSCRRPTCCSTTPSIVPVGEDQRQHIELTRDLGQRFNSRFGETFTIPEVSILKETAKIYDLQDPTAKMSKSGDSDKGTVWLLDEPSVTAKKIKSAVTDTDGEVRFDPVEKPGVSNLLTLLSVLGGSSIPVARVGVRGARLRRPQVGDGGCRGRRVRAGARPCARDARRPGRARPRARRQRRPCRGDRAGDARARVRPRRVPAAGVARVRSDGRCSSTSTTRCSPTGSRSSSGIAAHRSTLGGALAAADRAAEFVRWNALEERHYHRYLTGELDFLGQRRERAREFVAPYGLLLDDDAADAWYDAYLVHYEATWTLHDDVLDCLEALRPARFGVITNGHLEAQTAKIDGDRAGSLARSRRRER